MTKRRLTRAATAAAALAALLAGLACLSPAASAQARRPGQPQWAWSGAVTPTSATVKARIALPSKGARLRVMEQGAPDPHERTLPADGWSRPGPAGIVAFTLAELRPATRYRYIVETEEGGTLAGGFRTFGQGAFAFRVAFASCASTGSNSPVFDAIRALSPDLFIHMGDFHYENIAENAPARFLRAYDRVLASPRQSALYRSVPIAYVWDDHDFGPDNADGRSPSKPAALSTYKQMVPHYPLGTPENGSINHAFTVGRVRFIVTDSRSHRDPSGARDTGAKTMLGPVQLEWLEREFEAATGYALVVWVNGVPWITRRLGNTDGWEQYGRERSRIADHIDRLGLTRRLIMLSGDAHMVAIDDGTNSNYVTGAPTGSRGFPVAHAGPLDRRTSEKGGPYSQGVSRKRGQFGVMDVSDDGTTIRIELTGRQRDGGVIARMRLLVICQAGGCEVVERGVSPASEP